MKGDKSRPVGDSNELLVVGCAGGTLSIRKIEVNDGDHKYLVHRNESAWYSLLDEEEREDLELEADYGLVDTFTTALHLIKEYQWHRLTPVRVHSECQAEVMQAVRRLAETDDILRWERFLAGSSTTPAAGEEMPQKKTDGESLTPSERASRAAHRAWETMRSPVYKARKTARLSQAALQAWSAQHGYYCTFLDAPSGNPRTGVVDALLTRIGANPDDLEIQLVQLKGGSAGLTATERTRLLAATRSIRIGAAVALWDGENLSVDPLGAAETASGTKKELPRKGRSVK